MPKKECYVLSTAPDSPVPAKQRNTLTVGPGNQRLATSAWFSGHGKGITLEQMAAQAIYVHAALGQSLTIPDDENAYSTSKVQTRAGEITLRSTYHIYGCIAKECVAACPIVLKGLVKFCAEHCRLKNGIHGGIQETPEVHGGGQFIEEMMDLFRTRGTILDVVKMLNSRLEQLPPNGKSPWECYLDAKLFPGSSSSELKHQAHPPLTILDIKGQPFTADHCDATGRLASKASVEAYPPPVRTILSAKEISTEMPNGKCAVLDTGSSLSVLTPSVEGRRQLDKKLRIGTVGGASAQFITHEGSYVHTFIDFHTRILCSVRLHAYECPTPGGHPIIGVGETSQAGFSLHINNTDGHHIMYAPKALQEARRSDGNLVFPDGCFAHIVQHASKGMYWLHSDFTKPNPRQQVIETQTAFMVDDQWHEVVDLKGNRHAEPECLLTTARESVEGDHSTVNEFGEVKDYEVGPPDPDYYGDTSRPASRHGTNPCAPFEDVRRDEEQTCEIIKNATAERAACQGIHRYLGYGRIQSECIPAGDPMPNGFTESYVTAYEERQTDIKNIKWTGISTASGPVTGREACVVTMTEENNLQSIPVSWCDHALHRLPGHCVDGNTDTNQYYRTVKEAIDAAEGMASAEEHLCLRLSAEVQVGQSAEVDHLILNHCGADKHERTLRNSHSNFEKLSQQTQAKYVKDIYDNIPSACDSCKRNLPRKPVIRQQRRLQGKQLERHLQAVAQQNEVAESAKQVVRDQYKIFLEDAFDRPAGTSMTNEQSAGKVRSDVFTTTEAHKFQSHGELMYLHDRDNPITDALNIPQDQVFVTTGSAGETDETEHWTTYTWLAQVPQHGHNIDRKGYIQRFALTGKNALRPYERAYVDVKTLPKGQFQGKDYAVFMVDYATLTIDVELIRFKHETSEVLEKMLVERNVHRLPYQTTIAYDGDGSNLAISVMAARLGIRTCPTIPYRQSLNLAELGIRIIVHAAKCSCFHAKFHPMYLGLALRHAAHHHSFISGSESRNGKSPYELRTGNKPDLSEMRIFGAVCHTVKPDPKKRNGRFNRKNPLELLTTTTPGFVIGYQSVDQCGCKTILTLQGNIVHSADVYFFGGEDPREKYTDLLPKVFLQSFDGGRSFQNMADLMSAYHSKGYTNMTDEELCARTKLIPIQGTNYQEYVPEGDTLDAILTRFYPDDSRQDAREQLLQFVLEEEETDEHELPAGWEEASEVPEPQPEVIVKPQPTPAGEDTPAADLPTHSLRGGRSRRFADVHTVCETDGHANQEGNQTTPLRYYDVNMGCYVLAEEATWKNDKDIPWDKALKMDGYEKPMTEAFNKEYKSLTETHAVLKRIYPGDNEYNAAVKQACLARALLSIKRSQEMKARFVLRGDLQEKEKVDGPGFNYYARVVSMTAVRAALATFNSTEETMAFADVSTAFLQAHKYDDSQPAKYVKMKNPITKEWMFFRQTGPLYGENSAPKHWETTISEWIQAQGFVRGSNDPCIYYHAGRKLKVLLYVDDLQMIGKAADIQWFYDNISKRFEVKPMEWLQPGVTIDYLGMEVSMDSSGNVFVSMQKYTKKVIDFFDDVTGHALSTPYQHQENPDLTELSKSETRRFQTGLGMVGWLVSCIRADICYTYSMLGQSMSAPTVSSMEHLFHLVRYLKDSQNQAGIILKKHANETLNWQAYTDSDQASDRSERNKGKSRNGAIVTLSGFPVIYKSKTTSVAMAQPEMSVDGNACVSSTEAEIYAAANATFDIMHLSYVVSEMGCYFPKPFILYMDNAAAEIFCNNTASYSRLKHIDQRQRWVTSLRDSNLMVPAHISTKVNVADLFTKALSGFQFSNLRSTILIKMCTIK